jgi:hypothetical protein
MIAVGLLLLLANHENRAWMRELAASGRVLEIAERPSERLSPPRVAPGAPPVFSFRFFEGKQRHRFGDLDLVIDDAGH